jgi:hypothetical protein
MCQPPRRSDRFRRGNVRDIFLLFQLAHRLLKKSILTAKAEIAAGDVEQ